MDRDELESEKERIYAHVLEKVMRYTREEIDSWTKRTNLVIRSAQLFLVLLSLLGYIGYNRIDTLIHDSIAKQVENSSKQMNERIGEYADDAATYALLAKWDATRKDDLLAHYERDKLVDIGFVTRSVKRAFEDGMENKSVNNIPKLLTFANAIRNASQIANQIDKQNVGRDLSRLIQTTHNQGKDQVYREYASIIVQILDSLEYYADTQFYTSVCALAKDATKDSTDTYSRYVSYLSNLRSSEAAQCLKDLLGELQPTPDSNRTATLLALAQNPSQIGFDDNPTIQYLSKVENEDITSAKEWAVVLAVAAAYTGNFEDRDRISNPWQKLTPNARKVIRRLLHKFADEGYRVIYARQHCYVVGEAHPDSTNCIDNVGNYNAREFTILQLAADCIRIDIADQMTYHALLKAFAPINISRAGTFNDTVFSINSFETALVRTDASEEQCDLYPLYEQISSKYIVNGSIYLYWDNAVQAMWYDRFRELRHGSLISISAGKNMDVWPIPLAKISQGVDHMYPKD